MGQMLSLSASISLQWGEALLTHRALAVCSCELGNASYHLINLTIGMFFITESVVLGFLKTGHNRPKNNVFSELGLSKQIFAGLLRTSVDLKARLFLSSFCVS